MRRGVAGEADHVSIREAFDALVAAFQTERFLSRPHAFRAQVIAGRR